MIKLLSTDFDGTLVNPLGNPSVDPELFEVLGTLRANGVLWAMNTGRALGHILEGLNQERFPLQPDFLLSSERHIFRPNPNSSQGWEDFGAWNAQCDRTHEALFAAAGSAIGQIKAYIEGKTGARYIDDESGTGFVARSEEEVDQILAFIDSFRNEHPDFSYQRNTVYVRFCHRDYSKGAALGELGRLLGISRDEIFAAGDHLNDLTMLDGRHARWVACPCNSAPEVKEMVRQVGGHVAQGHSSTGIVEALKGWFGHLFS